MKKKTKLDPWIQKIIDAREKRANAPICKPGKHKLQVVATCGTTSKMLNCKVCSFGLGIPLNAHEIKAVEADRKRQDKETKILHGLGWKYQKEFYHYDVTTLDDIQWKAEQERVKRLNSGLKTKPFKARRVNKIHNGFKWEGYELMQHFDKFAKKHPEVNISGCDDTYHASSYIVLIPHETDNEFWGYTVVIVPQMGPFPPTEIFLYPGHAEQLAKVLFAAVKKYKQKKMANTKDNYCPDTSIPKWFKDPGL